MKGQKIWLKVLVVMVLIAIFVYFFRAQKKISIVQNVVAPGVEEVAVTNGDCGKKDLLATMNFEGAAGSIYGSFEIKNISKTKCNISGENTIQLNYDSAINNIKVNFEENTKKMTFPLEPGASISAVARMQNGPQCSGKLAPTNVKIIYTANKQVLNFVDLTGKQDFMINRCLSDKEITQVTMSSLK
jgi:hypothetical protein